MNARTFLKAIFIAALPAITNVSCSNAQKVETTPKMIPEQFAFTAVGSDMGFSIYLQDRSFWHVSYENGKAKTSRLKCPSFEKWRKFWAASDSIKVWQWSGRYENNDPNITVDDGERWLLKLSNNGISIDVSGDNSYPSDGNPRKSGPPVHRTKCYDDFVDAVTNLFDLKDIYYLK